MAEKSREETYADDVKESQAEVAKELVPCPTCGTTVARVHVCATDAQPAAAEKESLPL